MSLLLSILTWIAHNCVLLLLVHVYIYLAEHLGTSSFGGFVGGAVHTHGFPVTGELESELFLPHLLDDMGRGCSSLTLAQVAFVGVVIVHLLGQNNKGSLSGFSYLLIYVLCLQQRLTNY